MALAAYVADRIASVIMVDNLIFRFLAVTAGSVINVCLQLAGTFAKFQTAPLHRRHTFI
jgi:hypothetical protein